MPLNIDLQQIILHVLNFIILAGGLYILLFKPVKNFMDKRQEYYKQLDEEAKQAISDAEAKVAEYEKKLSGIDNEIAEKKSLAVKEADKVFALQLESAKKNAEKIIEEAKKSAEIEKKKMIDSAQDEIRQLALDAAEKLVNEQSEISLRDFLNSVKED